MTLTLTLHPHPNQAAAAAKAKADAAARAAAALTSAPKKGGLAKLKGAGKKVANPNPNAAKREPQL